MVFLSQETNSPLRILNKSPFPLSALILLHLCVSVIGKSFCLFATVMHLLTFVLAEETNSSSGVLYNHSLLHILIFIFLSEKSTASQESFTSVLYCIYCPLYSPYLRKSTTPLVSYISFFFLSLNTLASVFSLPEETNGPSESYITVLHCTQ